MSGKTDDGIIPMTLEHQRLILAGVKTTTLRSKRFNGAYLMVNRDGTLGKITLYCPNIPPRLICWTNLTPAEKVELAKTEGYDTVDGFEAAARSLRLGRFIKGESVLWVHTIAEVDRA